MEKHLDYFFVAMTDPKETVQLDLNRFTAQTQVLQRNVGNLIIIIRYIYIALLLGDKIHLHQLHIIAFFKCSKDHPHSLLL